jgi:dienelactone hydrolase
MFARLRKTTACRLQRILCALLAVSILVLCDAALAAQQTVPVWADGVPEPKPVNRHEIDFYEKPLPSSPPMKMIRNVVEPTLTVYHPKVTNPNTAAVIICPGGGGVMLDWRNEGTNVAEWLSSHGVVAFVLKYRLAQTPEAPEDFQKFLREGAGSSWNTSLALGIADARHAVRMIRVRAAEWNLSSDRIGVMGFSIGGFIATAIAVDQDAESRPNFVAAIYSGENSGQPVPAYAPPLFEAVAQDDPLMSQPALKLYWTWTVAKRSAELHIFAKGGHGFGTIKQGLPVDGWLNLVSDWMVSQGFINSR